MNGIARYGARVHNAREREIKFQVDEGFELPELEGESLDARTFTSTYYDTPDRRLATVDLTLRRRVENGRGVWQLKLPECDARREIEAPGGPARPPDDIATLLLALTRGRRLEAVAKLRTRRTGLRVSQERSQADVVVDEVAVLDARRVVDRFTEVEIEVIEGDDGSLDTVAKALRGAGARGNGRLVPKVARVVGPPPSGGGPTLAGEAEVLRDAIRSQLRALLAHDPGTRLGTDAEGLHDMRVAVRRLRAILKIAEPALDETWARDLRDRLKWLAGELGPVRDLDVMVEDLARELDALDEPDGPAGARILRDLGARRGEARSALVAALRSEPYLDLIDDLEQAARSPQVVGRVELEHWATKAFKRLRRIAGPLDESAPDDDLHEARKAGKRARYAAELAEPIAGKAASRFVKESKRFQDLVGDHQDAVVAEDELRRLAQGRSSAAVLAVGRLIERRRHTRQESRGGYRRAWKRLEKAGRAAWT